MFLTGEQTGNKKELWRSKKRNKKGTRGLCGNGKLQKGINGKLLKMVWQGELDNAYFVVWQEHIFLCKDSIWEVGPSLRTQAMT